MTLDAFHVREKDAVRVSHEPLKDLTQGLISKMGVPVDDAALAADVLVSADLKGHDSHGVSNMLPLYINWYGDGRINPRPNWKIVRDRPSAATIDCDRGLGVILGPKAMEIAIEKAKVTGVGMVTLAKGQHMGMAQYHARLALEHDMIGVCMTASTSAVPPTFGREARLGTNPISFAAPSANEGPFVLDMATSTIAVNKFRNAKRLGEKLPPGMIAGIDGVPIMSSVLVPDEYFPLPLGSTREMGSHKGYGLAAMVEILCSLLSGSGFVARDGPFQHMVAAYSIDAFTDVKPFKDDMDEFIRSLKSTEPAAGQKRVLVPGEPEAEEEVERLTRGIPLHRDVVKTLRRLCLEYQVECEI